MFFISRLRQKYQTGGVETSTNGSKFPARFFIHIPKTAGTSFRQSVVDHFGQKRVLQDYGGKRAATSAAIREYIYATGDTTSITEAMASEDSVMVSGHVHAAKYAGTIGLPNTVTFVRQPVDRVVSHYRHMARDEGFEGGLMSFAREPAYRNTQSRVMDFLDPALFGVVGITEQYQSSIDLVNAHWNWRLSHRADNVSDKMSGLKVIPSAEEEALITDLNSKDVALCDRAHHVFKNSLFCLTLDLKSEPRGAISTARDKQGISGWSFNMFSDQPSEIEVLVNQEIKGNLKCVDFRPALAGWKVPRNGYIGFHLRSVSLNEGDTVEIRDIEHQLILDSTIV